MNLSNTHGENKYQQKKNNNGKNVSSRRNIKAKVIRNGNSIYSQSKVTAPPKPVNLVNVVINSVFRVAIVGIGMGTLFGTFLANRDLTKPLFPKIDLPFVSELLDKLETPISKSPEVVAQKTPEVSASSPTPQPETKKESPNDALTFTKEDKALKNKLNELKTKYPQLEPSAFFVDLDTGVYVNSNGIKALPAASTIKIPILVAFLQDVDAGKIYLDEKLTMTEAHKVTGSGSMQYQGVGRQYSAIETATEMIISSDNSATEMIVQRLGGKDALNKRFQEWGLEHTVIKNILPDLEGTNTTSARDLVILLAKVNQGKLISLRSRDRLMDIMTRTKTRTLLPQGLEEGAMIAHKTGDIGKILGDAGIIDMPTGKRYVGAVFASRPHNDVAGRTLIQEISRAVYQHFKWYMPRSSGETKPATNN